MDRMDLKTWMKEKRVTAEQFADRVGASASAVGKWRRGERRPDEVFMARIACATDHQVLPGDFYNLPSFPKSSHAPKVATAGDAVTQTETENV